MQRPMSTKGLRPKATHKYNVLLWRVKKMLDACNGCGQSKLPKILKVVPFGWVSVWLAIGLAKISWKPGAGGTPVMGRALPGFQLGVVRD
jgi:hypothetical protein